MCRSRRTIRRVMQSRSVKKKSLTSASPRSMFSTRKTRQRRRTASRSHGAVAVVVAVAEAAGVAAVAGAASVAAVAASPGALAARAKADQFPLRLIDANCYGRVRHSRPGQSMFQYCPPDCAVRSAPDDRTVSLLVETYQRASCMREFQWSENTGEPAWPAGYAC